MVALGLLMAETSMLKLNGDKGRVTRPHRSSVTAPLRPRLATLDETCAAPAKGLCAEGECVPDPGSVRRGYHLSNPRGTEPTGTEHKLPHQFDLPLHRRLHAPASIALQHLCAFVPP